MQALIQKAHGKETNKKKSNERGPSNSLKKQKKMVSKTELYSIETKNKIITVTKHLFNIPLKPVSMTRFVRLVLLHWFKTFPSLMLDVIEESLVNLHQAVLQISPEPTNKTHSKEDQKPKQIKQEEDKQIKKRHKKSDDRKFRKN